MSRNPHLRGILYATLGFTVWVIVDALMKLAAEAELPPYEVVGAMGICGATIMALRSMPKGGIRTIWPRNLKVQIFFTLCGLVSNYANVIALKHLPLTVFYIVVFTAPMMMALLARFTLKEPLGWLKFLAIVTGFGGTVIAINPGTISGGTLIGYIAGFVSAAAFAGNVVLSRFLMRDEAPESLTFFSGFVQAIACIVMSLFTGPLPPLTGTLALILIAAGSLNVIGNLCAFLSVKYAPTTIIASYHYTQIIAGAVVAFFVWHEWPSMQLMAGAAIIIASGIYIAAHGGKTEEQAILTEAAGIRE